MSGSNYTCFCIHAGSKPYVLQPGQDSWTIGKMEDNDIVIDEKWLQVSMHHCYLRPGQQRL